jgi:hypothetical protein
LVHLIEAPEYFEDATYLELLFLANLAGAILTAAGIYKVHGAEAGDSGPSSRR